MDGDPTATALAGHLTELGLEFVSVEEDDPPERITPSEKSKVIVDVKNKTGLHHVVHGTAGDFLKYDPTLNKLMEKARKDEEGKKKKGKKKKKKKK